MTRKCTTKTWGGGFLTAFFAGLVDLSWGSEGSFFMIDASSCSRALCTLALSVWDTLSVTVFCGNEEHARVKTCPIPSAMNACIHICFICLQLLGCSCLLLSESMSRSANIHVARFMSRLRGVLMNVHAYKREWMYSCVSFHEAHMNDTVASNEPTWQKCPSALSTRIKICSR